MKTQHVCVCEYLFILLKAKMSFLYIIGYIIHIFALQSHKENS